MTTPVKQKGKSWLEWCDRCERRHRLHEEACRSCGVYRVIAPVAESVYQSCPLFGFPECDGCEAYREHQS